MIIVKINSPFLELRQSFKKPADAEKYIKTAKRLHDINHDHAVRKISSKGSIWITHNGEKHLLTGSLDIPGMHVETIDTQYTLELN